MMTTSIETITPEMAEAYLAQNEGNRRISNNRVAYYADMMAKGAWELNGEALKFTTSGRLLDGQHRLKACIQAAVPFETLVVRDISEEVFDTLDQGWLRGGDQVFNLAKIPNSASVYATIRKYLNLANPEVSSLRTAANVKCRKHSPRECLAEYADRADYWQRLNSMALSMYNRCRLMCPSDISAVTAHLNLRCGYDLDYVVEFFNQLFFEERTQMDVIRGLRRRLVKDMTSQTRMTPQGRTQLIRKTWDCYKQQINPVVLKWTRGVEEAKPFE